MINSLAGAEDALQRLLLSNATTLVDVQRFVEQLPIDAPGNTTLFFTGYIQGNSHTGEAAQSLAESDPSIRFIQNSVAAKVLLSDDFKALVAKAFGVTFDEVDVAGGAAKAWLDDPTNGPWADVSRRFAETATGDVRVIAHWADPLLLDLYSNGLGITGLRDTAQPVFFDADGDGGRTATAWAAADDGLIALDRNGNGAIDSGLELFGDQTLMFDGRRARHGFEALADLDSNRDGVFDAGDPQFGAVWVWRDAGRHGLRFA
jgi:hypothetical protein